MTQPVAAQPRELAPWSTDGKPPKRFCLFYFGRNKTTKGTIHLTKRSAQKCIANWIDYGNHLSGDYNHAITNPNIENPRASCWFKLAIEKDGLYAVDVKYTAAAAQAIEAKELLYYSPYCQFEKDRHGNPCVVEIVNIALTNVPATKHQRPLVALSKLAKGKTMFTQEQIDALKAMLVEAGVAEEKASDAILKMQSLICAPMMEEAPMEKMPLADPMPQEEEKKEEFKMEEYQALSKAYTAQNDIIKGLEARLSNLEKEKEKQAVNAKDQLFAQFKREGRLRMTDEKAAREILDLNPELFRKTFGAVAPLTATKPPCRS